MEEDEKLAIVVDIGTGSVKAGFAGVAPSYVRGSCQYDPDTGERVAVVRRGQVVNWERLLRVWRGVFAGLAVDPGMFRVLCVVPTFTTEAVLRRTAEYLFHEVGAAEVCLGDSATLCAGAADVSTGIVVETGAGVTVVSAMLDGELLQDSVRVLHVGGDDATELLGQLLYGAADKLACPCYKCLERIKQAATGGVALPSRGSAPVSIFDSVTPDVDELLQTAPIGGAESGTGTASSAALFGEKPRGSLASAVQQMNSSAGRSTSSGPQSAAAHTSTHAATTHALEVFFDPAALRGSVGKRRSTAGEQQEPSASTAATAPAAGITIPTGRVAQQGQHPQQQQQQRIVRPVKGLQEVVLDVAEAAARVRLMRESTTLDAGVGGDDPRGDAESQQQGIARHAARFLADVVVAGGNANAANFTERLQYEIDGALGRRGGAYGVMRATVRVVHSEPHLAAWRHASNLVYSVDLPWMKAPADALAARGGAFPQQQQRQPSFGAPRSTASPVRTGRGEADDVTVNSFTKKTTVLSTGDAPPAVSPSTVLSDPLMVTCTSISSGMGPVDLGVAAAPSPGEVVKPSPDAVAEAVAPPSHSHPPPSSPGKPPLQIRYVDAQQFLSLQGLSPQELGYLPVVHDPAAAAVPAVAAPVPMSTRNNHGHTAGYPSDEPMVDARVAPARGGGGRSQQQQQQQAAAAAPPQPSPAPGGGGVLEDAEEPLDCRYSPESFVAVTPGSPALGHPHVQHALSREEVMRRAAERVQPLALRSGDAQVASDPPPHAVESDAAIDTATPPRARALLSTTSTAPGVHAPQHPPGSPSPPQPPATATQESTEAGHVPLPVGDAAYQPPHPDPYPHSQHHAASAIPPLPSALGASQQQQQYQHPPPPPPHSMPGHPYPSATAGDVGAFGASPSTRQSYSHRYSYPHPQHNGMAPSMGAQFVDDMHVQQAQAQAQPHDNGGSPVQNSIPAVYPAEASAVAVAHPHPQQQQQQPSPHEVGPGGVDVTRMGIDSGNPNGHPAPTPAPPVPPMPPMRRQPPRASPSSQQHPHPAGGYPSHSAHAHPGEEGGHPTGVVSGAVPAPSPLPAQGAAAPQGVEDHAVCAVAADGDRGLVGSHVEAVGDRMPHGPASTLRRLSPCRAEMSRMGEFALQQQQQQPPHTFMPQQLSALQHAPPPPQQAGSPPHPPGEPPASSGVQQYVPPPMPPQQQQVSSAPFREGHPYLHHPHDTGDEHHTQRATLPPSPESDPRRYRSVSPQSEGREYSVPRMDAHGGAAAHGFVAVPQARVPPAGGAGGGGAPPPHQASIPRGLPDSSPPGAPSTHAHSPQHAAHSPVQAHGGFPPAPPVPPQPPTRRVNLVEQPQPPPSPGPWHIAHGRVSPPSLDPHAVHAPRPARAADVPPQPQGRVHGHGHFHEVPPTAAALKADGRLGGLSPERPAAFEEPPPQPQPRGASASTPPTRVGFRVPQHGEGGRGAGGSVGSAGEGAAGDVRLRACRWAQDGAGSRGSTPSRAGSLSPARPPALVGRGDHHPPEGVGSAGHHTGAPQHHYPRPWQGAVGKFLNSQPPGPAGAGPPPPAVHGADGHGWG